MTEVVNNRAQHRYELTVDGHLAATYYKMSDGVITFIHTEVPPELGGKGIGSRLIRGALDQVRAEGLKVIAAVSVREGLYREERRLSGSACSNLPERDRHESRPRQQGPPAASNSTSRARSPSPITA